MIRIAGFGRYIPEGRFDNLAVRDKFDLTEDFLATKIGVLKSARKNAGEETSDLCRTAFGDLAERTGIRADDIDALIVVTQNPDGSGLPHTAAAVHDKIGAKADCAAFDISQGCAGFVYGLAATQGFMATNGLRRAVLFTADPYSKIVDPEDRNTVLLFGDAAAATLIETVDGGPGWRAGNYRFLTLGADRAALENRGGTLFMNGRAIFNFAATHVPREIEAVMESAQISVGDIDLFALHQGSKYIVDTICRRMKLTSGKVPFEIGGYGNTVSSSLPLLLYDKLNDEGLQRILLCGFGVGLSIATCMLERI